MQGHLKVGKADTVGPQVSREAVLCLETVTSSIKHFVCRVTDELFDVLVVIVPSCSFVNSALK